MPLPARTTWRKWFAQQREIIAAEYEKEMTEKLKDAEKKTTKKVKAAKKAKKESESDRPDSSSDAPTDPSSPLEWFVSFTVTHVEKDEEIPCGESHAAEVEELVGQIAGTAGIEPRLMRVGTCENLNKKKREFEVSFSVGDVEDTDEEIASARAKDMVKLFSNDAVRAMLMVDGKDESEAKRATSEFKVEASRVEFDRRPKETMPPPDFTAPVPLSSEHVGHFHVGGAQTDAQIKRMLAQVAVDRGMPSDNIPNINIEKCPFDYHVTFDVSVLGFGCPGGDAANDGQFAKQYKSYMYKFAELADPPLVLPDTVAVSDCVPPSRQSDDEGESQSFTVSFDVPRASERTDPARLAKEVMNLFDVDNIRQHAADVGVSAHLLHQMGVDARTSKNRVALVLDPGPVRAISPRLSSTGRCPKGSSLRRGPNRSRRGRRTRRISSRRTRRRIRRRRRQSWRRRLGRWIPRGDARRCSRNWRGTWGVVSKRHRADRRGSETERIRGTKRPPSGASVVATSRMLFEYYRARGVDEIREPQRRRATLHRRATWRSRKVQISWQQQHYQTARRARGTTTLAADCE